ncbi:MAG: NosD domain-containing protein [Planctomycetia bacterium]|nr:NosD domain-containing protein [Planctomycetia bacterium]
MSTQEEAGPRRPSQSSARHLLSRRFRAGRRSTRARGLEPLEDRRLLALTNLLPQYEDPLTGEQSALWNPKQAQFSTIDQGLYRTSLEHRFRIFTDDGSNFTPSDPEMLVADGFIVIDAQAEPSAGAALQAEIMSLGGRVTGAFGDIVSAFVPLNRIDALARLDSLAYAAPAYAPVANAGQVQTQGDAAMLAAAARALGADGSGVKIGLISDSFNRLGGYATDLANGEFPTPVTTVVELPPLNIVPHDEGRALAQIVADVAPGAQSFFNTGVAGIGNFVSAMNNLRNRGVNMIVDDLIFLTEPMFQDGAISQAIKSSTDAGIAHFSSAGNYADHSAEFGAFIDSGIDGVNGGVLHDFDSGPDVDAFQQITVPVGKSFRLSFQWDEPFFVNNGGPGVPSPGSASDVDILLLDAAGAFAFDGGVNFNVGRNPVEVFQFVNDGTFDFDEDGVPDTEFSLAFELFFGPAPERMKYVDFDGGMIIEEYASSAPTSFGHFGAEGVFAVAAAPYWTTPAFDGDPAILNDYSSLGRQVILFDPSGNRLAEPIVRHHPDATGPDQGDTTFFIPGIDIEPNGLPNFPGTSAAAPHVAAVAALMLDAAGGPGSLSVQSLYTGLKYTAHDILQRDTAAPEDIPGGAGYDYFSGHGLVDAEAAVQGALNGFDLVIDANDVAGDPALNDGDPADDGVADVFSVSLDGTEVVVVINGIEAARMDLAAINTLTIVGSGDDDELVLDLAGGNPIPAGGLEFQAGNDAGTGDRLHWRNGAPFDLIHTVTGLSSGTTLIDSGSVTYVGVELVVDQLTPVHREIRLTEDAQFASISDGAAASDGINRLGTTGTSPTFDFAAATGETRIFLGDADDQVQIDALDDEAAAAIEILLGDGDDQVLMVPQQAAALHLDGGPQFGLDELLVNALNVGVTDTGSVLEFVGFLDVTYADFEKLSVSNAGEGGGLPDVTIADVSLAEGSAGGFTEMTFTVKLSVANASHSAFVDYFTVDGTAEDEQGDGDYLAVAGTLEFPPNTLEQTIVVQIAHDAVLEPTEQFTVQLANAVNANLLDEAAQGVIVNDDFPPAGVAYVDDDWAGLPIGADPDGVGPAVSFGADSFADFPEALAVVVAGGSILMHPGQYTGAAINQDVSVLALTLGVTISGASPALTVLGGAVTVNGVTLDTASDDATIVVAGGSLTLRATTVRETAAGAQSALLRTGGTVNLGDSLESGLNTFEVRGEGRLIDNQSAGDIPALGNIWLHGGVTLDNFQIEDRIDHAIDEAARGLVSWIEQTLFVTSLAPGAIDASHNNYRRLANMSAALSDGATAYLRGVFDFAEPNTLADWATGNDGLAGTVDDYAVLLPGELSDLKLTAETLGAATIVGPGDLAVVDLEGVFRFAAEDSHDWEISRLEIFDFDLAIDLSGTENNDDARDGLRIVGNHLRLATDLNFDDAPADFFQNIGIALGPGHNQTVSGNRIDIPGNALSDGSQFAASVGIQSSPHSPAAYDGLLIENNSINILHGQSEDPSTIVGIWDAGEAHESDITIRGNKFLNLAAGNDPRKNLQRAFRVTSHSGTSSVVLYENNTIVGANMGFQWQPGADFSGQAPVLLHNNAIEEVIRGIVVSSSGSAHISGNTLTGLGSNDGIGIDVQFGATASIDGNTADNSIHGFAKGVFVKGDADIFGNAATISGNAIGIDIDGGTASILGNHINANDTGIRITDAGTATSIANNFIVDNTSDGVRITATAGEIGLIFNNSLSNNGNRSIRNQSGALVDASGNWWGINTPDGVNQVEQGDVDFSPWLDSGTDIDGDSTNGFQGDFSTLHVDDDSPQAGDAGLIQEGINWALAGGTLIVHNGLYRESNSTVDRPLTVSGESRGGVVIAPGAEDDHTDIAFGGDFQQGFIVQSSDVVIQNLTINGRANSGLTPGRNNFRTGVISDRRTGVVYHRTRIENVDVLHIWRRGVELFSSEAPGAPRSVDNIIRDARIEDVTTREAILVREGNALITGNTIIGATIGIGANDRGDFTNAPVVIIQQNTLRRVNQGVALSGAANGSLVGGLGGFGNVIDLTEGNSDDIGVFVQYSQGQVAIAGNEILAERDDSGIWLFHNEDATRPIIVANNQITSSLSSSDGPGRGVGVFLTDDGDLFGDEDGASYATILGNTITGFEIGVDLYRNGTSPAGGRTVEATIGDGLEMNNNTLDDNTIGVRVFENDGASNGGHRAVAHILGNTASITGGRVGVEVNGGAAEIVGNRIGENNVGIRVLRDGIAMLEDNNLTDNNSIGLLIETGGIVDAGQEGLGTDFTGFGASHGGNDFSSYVEMADENDGAIVNLNEDNVVGRQGVPPDVSARGNLFFATATNDIEDVIYHDSDDDDLGFVDFFGLQNLVLTFSADPVAEGTPLTLDGSFESDSAGPHEVTIDWGDGDVDTLTVPAGVFSFSVIHTYDDDDPTGTESDLYPVLVTVEDTTGPASIVKPTNVTVANVAPAISDLAVTPAIDEAGEVHLTGPIADVGTLDSFVLRVDWGDGSVEDFPFPAGTTAFDVTHVYADDNPTATAADVYQIQVTLADDDGGEDQADVATTVTNLPPSAAIDGAPVSGEVGLPIELTGLFDDVGTQDTHTLRWEVLRDGLPFATGDGASFSFTPTLAGSYQVTFTVLDDDLGVGSDEVTIEVSAVPVDAPAVSQVLASSTAWQTGFFDLLTTPGYVIPAGADQWTVLPWVNLDQIRVVFTEDVVVAEDDLSIAGVNVGQYLIDSFAYDALSFTATWTLTAPIAVDLVTLSLVDTIIDVDDGLALDGEWTNAVSAFPSGDATAGGGFEFSFRVLPGDIDRSGDVGITDLNYVRNNFGELATDIVGDLSGSGAIDIVDLNAVRNNFGEQAVSIPPPPMMTAASGNAADQLFTIADGDDEFDWWNRRDADGDDLAAVNQASWESVLEDWNNPGA